MHNMDKKKYFISIESKFTVLIKLAVATALVTSSDFKIKKKLSSIADGLKATFLNKQLATNIIRKKNNTIKNAMKNVFCYKRRDMCHKRFTSFKIRTNNTKK